MIRFTLGRRLSWIHIYVQHTLLQFSFNFTFLRTLFKLLYTCGVTSLINNFRWGWANMLDTRRRFIDILHFTSSHLYHAYSGFERAFFSFSLFLFFSFSLFLSLFYVLSIWQFPIMLLCVFVRQSKTKETIKGNASRNVNEISSPLRSLYARPCNR